MQGMKKASKITAQERDIIAVLYSQGLLPSGFDPEGSLKVLDPKGS